MTRTIHVYTDGACSGNPGPMGVGVVIFNEDSPDGHNRAELSKLEGHGTNQQAELLAVGLGLQEAWRRVVDRTQDRVVVYSDSEYAIGLLSKNWRAKANQALVAEVRRQCQVFHNLTFVKVKGHGGDVENERADELATAAIHREVRR